MSQVRGCQSIAGCLFVYTEMEGAASVAGRPPGSPPGRTAACMCPIAPSSWGTMAVWKRKQGTLLWTGVRIPPLVTAARLVCPLAGAGRGQRSKAETRMEGPLLGTRRCREPRGST